MEKEFLKTRIRNSLKNILKGHREGLQDLDILFRRFNQQLIYGTEEEILSKEIVEKYRETYFRIIKMKKYEKVAE